MRRSASPTSHASAANASVSCSRASIFWRAPVRIENVGLPLYYSASGPTRRAVRVERARAALRFARPWRPRAQHAGPASGGQQQRVAIARALINSPSLLLADEPTGNLDTERRTRSWRRWCSLNREQGVTIVLVTHEARHRRLCGPHRDDARRRNRFRRAGEQTRAQSARPLPRMSAPRSSTRRRATRIRQLRPARIWHSG